MKKFKKIIFGYLSWRIVLIFFIFIGTYLFSLQNNYLGGGKQIYLTNPYLYSWLNFDGEHFLSIARLGYQPLNYFLFPLYPLLTKLVAAILGGKFINYVYSGLFISNFSFLIGIYGFWKIIRLYYSEKIAKFALLLLFFFPTSFFFGSFYSESLFFCLAIWSFYFARKENWFLSGLLAGLASTTRILGMALFAGLIIEFIFSKKNNNWKNFVVLVSFSLFGLIAYMIFLKLRTGDYLYFLHNVSIFGEQRSSKLVFFPQVIYRYIFKIIPNLNFSYFPVIYTTFMEFIIGILFLLLSIFSFAKQRYSYAVYSFSAFLIPSFSGSFSSVPRYFLISFPLFILMAGYLKNPPRYIRNVVFAILFILLLLSTALFSRGYWIS